eukprot:13483015-Alexandrium_andersonii.AAC.1
MAAGEEEAAGRRGVWYVGYAGGPRGTTESLANSAALPGSQCRGALPARFPREVQGRQNLLRSCPTYLGTTTAARIVDT